MGARRTTLALLVVAAGLAGWLLLGSGWRGSDEAMRPDAAAGPPAPPLEAPAAGPPILEGSGEPAPPPGPDRGPVTIRAELGEGRPYPWASIWVREEGDTRWVRADARGVHHLADVPYDGRVTVGLAVHGKPPEEPGGRWTVPEAAVRGPRVLLRSSRGLPYGMRLHDALGGRVLEAGRWRPTAQHPFVPLDARPILVPTSRRQGAIGRSRPEVEDVPSHLGRRPRAFAFVVAPEARALVAHLPVPPAAPVFVEAQEADGRPAPDVVVAALRFDGEVRRLVEPARPDALGRLRLEDLPRLPGARVSALVLRPEALPAVEAARRSAAQRSDWDVEIDGKGHHLRTLEDATVARAIVPADPRTPIVLRATLPPPGEAGEPWPFVSGSALVGLGGRHSVELLAFYAPSQGLPAVAVRAWRHDGAPAAGAWLHLAPLAARSSMDGEDPQPDPWTALITVTDAAGRARAGGLTPGRWRVTLNEPGCLPASATVEVVAGAETAVTLREIAGVRLDLQVVDVDGDPVPFARLERGDGRPLPVRWADEAAGLQRVDPYTDADGQAVFPRVAPGTWRLRVEGPASAKEVEVVVAEGERTRLEVRLPE